MAKPAFNALKRHLNPSSGQGIVFVSDRKQARLTALDFVTFTATDDNSRQFMGENFNSANMGKFSEKSLKMCLEAGIGFIHEGLSKAEISTIKTLYKEE